MQQVTLQPGDYVATKGMTKDEYHAAARAFINAGASCEKEDYAYDKWAAKGVCSQIGWDCRDDELWDAYCGSCNGFGRELTVEQVLNATNAGGKKTDMQNWTPADLFKYGDGEWGQREGDCYVTRSYKDGKLIKTVYYELGDTEKETDMHITDQLHKALQARDEAQALYEQTLAEHREAYPWLLIEERKQPTEDMSDPANWRAGDWLECIADKIDLTGGRFYRVKQMLGDPVIDDDDDEDIGRPAEYFRFHSRP